MTTQDPLIEQMIRDKKPMLISGKYYLIEKNPKGTCEGCVLYNELNQCPTRAVNICTSNGGNVFKELENGR